MRIKSPTDLVAGLLFGGIGFFVGSYAVAHYPLGNALQMGPGYFPVLVAGVLVMLSVALVLRSLRFQGPRLPLLRLRPTIGVLVACIAFGYLLKPLGLVLTTLLFVIGSAVAGPEFRWREALVLTGALAVFAVGVFVYGLGLPLPLLPQAMQ